MVVAARTVEEHTAEAAAARTTEEHIPAAAHTVGEHTAEAAAVHTAEEDIPEEHTVGERIPAAHMAEVTAARMLAAHMAAELVVAARQSVDTSEELFEGKEVSLLAERPAFPMFQGRRKPVLSAAEFCKSGRLYKWAQDEYRGIPA